jgi:site-specific DNA-methyltransferase (adenine-specific)
MERAEVSEAVVGTPSGACWNWEHHQLPSVAMWPTIKRVLGIPDKFDGLIEGDRSQFIAAARAVIGMKKAIPGVAFTTTGPAELAVTAPATADAARWHGWGTALKPAHEPIVVARRPLAGTVAANVLEHGTGALNIDGCRVGTDGGTRGATAGPQGAVYGDGLNGAFGKPVPGLGRWPANLVLTHAPDCADGGPCADGCPAAALDEQSGVLKSGVFAPHHADNGKAAGTYSAMTGRERTTSTYGDQGGASRFFPTFRYQPKAGRSERPTVDGVTHPTVKPLALMRWLVRLVTPPGGVVLDPFLGSGTTAQAARDEGFRCIGVELEEAHLPLIVTRLAS